MFNDTCTSTFGQVASRREEVNLIAAIERKRRKNYQTVNERRLLNSVHKRHMCTLPLFVYSKIIITDDGHPIHFADVKVIVDFSC